MGKPTYIIPSNPPPKQPLTLDSAQTAEQVRDWLARHMPGRPHPTIKRPINWIKWLSTFVIITGSLTLAYVAWPYVLPIIQSRNVWAAMGG